MKAVILVGGYGTRLRPLTCSRPKQLLPLGSSTLLEYMINQLETANINEIILAAGYGIKQLQKALGQRTEKGTKIQYSHEIEPLGTAGAIKHAESHLKGSGFFLALNGDIVSDIAYKELIKFHQQQKATATIALYQVDDPSRFGVVDLSPNGRVQSFIEKPAPGQAPSNLINAGCYVLNEIVLDYIPPATEVSIEREVFPKLCQEGKAFGWEHSGIWVDTGTPISFLKAHREILNKTVETSHQPSQKLHGDIKATSPFFIGADSKISAMTTIGPNVTIGQRVIVGSKSRIKNTVIFDDAIIAEGVVLDHCVIGQSAVIGKNLHLKDFVLVGDGAIIDSGAEIPSGAIVCPQCHVKKGTTPPPCLVKQYKALDI